MSSISCLNCDDSAGVVAEEYNDSVFEFSEVLISELNEAPECICNIPNSHRAAMVCYMPGDNSPWNYPPKCDVVICTKDKTIIELCDGLPVINANVGMVAERIEKHCVYINDYHFVIYYFIENIDELVILERKENSIQFIRHYKNVLTYKFTNEPSGAPEPSQLKISFRDGSTALAVLEEWREPSPVNEADADLHRRLQQAETDEDRLVENYEHDLRRARMHVEELQKDLEEKIALKQRLMQAHCSERILGVEYEEYVSLNEEQPSETASRRPPLQIAGTWTRSHNGKLVIGHKVRNTTERNIDIDQHTLVSKACPIFEYSTTIYALAPEEQQDEAPYDEDAVTYHLSKWKKLTIFPPNQTSYLMDVLEMPEFAEGPRHTFTSVIFYKEDKQLLQTHTQEVQIDVRDVLKNELQVKFHGNDDECDLLSVMASSGTATVAWLYLSQHSWNQQTLENALVNDFSFRYVTGPPGFFVSTGNLHHATHGALLSLDKMTDLEYRCHFFTKDDEQLLLLIHSFYAYLPMQSEITPHRRADPSKEAVAVQGVADAKAICHSLVKQTNILLAISQQCSQPTEDAEPDCRTVQLTDKYDELLDEFNKEVVLTQKLIGKYQK